MKRTIVCLACLLAWPMWSEAVSLSEPIVRSGLGQRLVVEVEVKDLERSAWPTLTAVVASPELYQEQGVEYPGSVSDMSVYVLRHGDGRPYFRLVGRRPLNEAFVEIILDVGWVQGHLVRKFTILPEPPSDDPAQQEGADGLTLPERLARKEQRFSKRTIDPAERITGEADIIRRTESVVSEEALVSSRGNHRLIQDHHSSSHRRFFVHRRENLFRVALRWKDSTLGVHQKMLALYYANPDVFIEGNPHRLIRGRWMATPRLTDRLPQTENEARAEWELLMHTPAQWLENRAVPLADESSSLSDSTAESENSEKTTIAPPIKNESTLEHNTEKNIVPSIVRRARLVVSDGVKEKEIQRYRKLLRMENEIRKLIQQTEQSAPALSLSKEIKPLDSSVSSYSSPQPTEAVGAGETIGMASAGSVGNDNTHHNVAPSASSVPGNETIAALPNPTSVTANTVPQQSATTVLGALSAAPQPVTPAALTDAESTLKPKAPISSLPSKKVRGPRRPVSPMMVDSVLNGIPWWVGLMAGSAGLLAVFTGVYSYRYHRRRRAAVEALLKESAELVHADSIFTDTGQSVVEVRASTTAADLAGAGSLNRESLLNVDTEAHVDPITEADVYISYERYDAAEGLLKSALEQQPESREILWRLMDVYNKLGRLIAARVLANRLHRMYEARDPKQMLICELLGVPFGFIAPEANTAEITTTETTEESAVSLPEEQNSTVISGECVIQETVLTQADEERAKLVEEPQKLDEETHGASISPSVPFINIAIPPLDFTPLEIPRQENVLKIENSEDDTIDSQLELAKLWVAQGKVSSARVLLEAIIETAKPSQKESALVVLNALSGT